MPEPVRQDNPAQEHASGCFVRLAWMLIGNLILAVCALSIIKSSGTFFSLADLVFWATVAAAIWLRYLDVSRLGGQTVYGQPATMAHWHRYAVLLPAAALVVWIIAHVGAQAGT